MGVVRAAPVGHTQGKDRSLGFLSMMLQRYWFLVALLIVIIAGLSGSRQLLPLAENRLLRNAIVVIVMFLMAFPLQTRAISECLRRPWPALLATGISFGVVPFLAWATSGLLDPSSAAGLLVVAATPCTLATAAVWTARAGGNDAVALMTTMISNGLCFFVTPLLVWVTVGRAGEIPAGELSRQLLLLVLLPMILAQCLRLSGNLAQWATRHKRPMNLLAQLGVLAMVLAGMVSTSRKIVADPSATLASGALIAVLCVVIHLLALGIGSRLARRLKMSRADQIAVGFAGSQKTLMVGLFVCLALGVSLLPMVIYHAAQLIVDTVIADRLAATARGSQTKRP
jgi:sodium/bile acid cotransporter 7